MAGEAADAVTAGTVRAEGACSLQLGDRASDEPSKRQCNDNRRNDNQRNDNQRPMSDDSGLSTRENRFTFFGECPQCFLAIVTVQALFIKLQFTLHPLIQRQIPR